METWRKTEKDGERVNLEAEVADMFCVLQISISSHASSSGSIATATEGELEV